MLQGLSTARTGMDAIQTRINAISNDLANVNTTSYKRARVVPVDLLYQKIRQPGGESSSTTEMPSGFLMGTGVRVIATQKDFSQGSPMQTDHDQDIMINGLGFFQILRPDGTTAYTRDGSFQQNSMGQFVTSDGYPLTPTITIPQGATGVNIAQDGTVSAQVNGTVTQIGHIQTAIFFNPQGLEPIGNNLYLETTSSGTPQTGTPNHAGYGSLVQGSLESSNVNVVESLVDLISSQRAYEMNARSVEAENEMMQFAVQKL